MRAEFSDPPRRFPTGGDDAREIRDHGRLRFEADDLVTLVAPGGKGVEVTATEWGLFATPSLEHRLRAAGLRAAVVSNSSGKTFVVLVDVDRMTEFEAFLAGGHALVRWLDEEPPRRSCWRRLFGRRPKETANVYPLW